MRKLIVNEFVSLDGVVQAPGGQEEDPSGGFAHGGWHMPYTQDERCELASALPLGRCRKVIREVRCLPTLRYADARHT